MKAPFRDELPASFGGPPMFPEGLPLARPSIGDGDGIAERVREISRSGVLTNGPLVRELEDRAAAYLGVRHCVAVASCTSGLMLVLRASGLSGDVIVPSFTFAATAHAVVWAGLRPVFADIEPDTLTLSADAARRAIGVRTAAVLATHVFGTPCDIEALSDVARANGLVLLFDAAHAFGSRHRGIPIGGSGRAEVFSLSPTKTLVAAEGGIVATNDDLLAERCRIGRDYGNPGDYDCRFVGLNARMSELHAAVALASFEGLEERVKLRNELAGEYRRALATIPGISFPRVPEGDISTYKDLTILVDERAFGMDAARLAASMAAEGIETRRYYAPPVHRMQSYPGASLAPGGVPATEAAARRVLTLPLWVGLTPPQVRRVAGAIARIQRHVGDEFSPA